jgi:fumarylpyruvate hydrolase
VANLFGSTYVEALEAVKQIRNVFCVGRNYRDHAVELGNAVPEKPLIFGKPTHALTAAQGALVLPADRSNIHHELEIVLYLKREHVPGRDFAEVVGGVGLGLDLTDRDAQSALKAAGQPWEFAKGFRNAAVVTDFREVADWDALQQTPFELRKNGKTVQSGVARDMLFSFQTLLDYIAQHFGLGEGDVVFTGTPAGVGPVHAGDELELLFGGEVWGHCTVEKRQGEVYHAADARN